MTFLFIILWTVSPLVLIPLLIYNISKKDKFSRFVNTLFRCGRISNDEYINLRVNGMNRTNPTNYGPPPVNNSPPPNYNPPPNFNPPPDYYQQYNQNVQNTKAVYNSNPQPVKTNSTPAMLIIGVVFVVLAGIIFSTATWVYMNGFQRTGVIILAGVFFFSISLLSESKLKLTTTSVAFYVLGSFFMAVSFICAGYFELFGQWFSLSGEARALVFSVDFILLSLFSAVAFKIFKKSFFVNGTLFTALCSVTFLAVQITDSYSAFVLVMNIVTALLTFGVYGFSIKFSEKFYKNICSFTKISFTIFAVSALPSILKFTDKSPCCYLTIAIFLAESLYFGVKKNSNLFKGTFAVLCGIMSLHFAVNLKNDAYGIFTFTVILFAFSIIFYLLKTIRTAFSDVAFNFGIFASAFSLMFYQEKASQGLSAIAFILLAFSSAVCAFDKGRQHFSVMRILLPVSLLFTAYELGLYFENLFLWEIIFAVIFVFSSLGFLLLWDNTNNNSNFLTLHYSFSVGAGVILFETAILSHTVSRCIVTLILLTLLFFVCNYAKNNIISLLPLNIIYFCAMNLSHIIDKSLSTEILTALILYFAFMIVSRFTFPNKFSEKENGKFRFDAVAITMINSPLIIYSHSENQICKFIALVCFSLFVMNFYRKENNEKTKKVLLSVSQGIFCLALYSQPFFNITNEIIRHKFNILPIILFSIILHTVWKDNKNTAKNLCFAVNLIAFLCLVYDAIYFDDLFNTLCVISVSLIILLWALIKREKVWFAISLFSLIMTTLYAMRRFLHMIDWWVYLLFAGILLITIASVNEFYKSKGINLKTKIKEYFTKQN